MGFFENAKKEPPYSVASGSDRPNVVMQVTLKEKFLGTGSGNLVELENVINEQVAKGYRLHTISTSTSGSVGLGGGDRMSRTPTPHPMRPRCGAIPISPHFFPPGEGKSPFARTVGSRDEGKSRLPRISRPKVRANRNLSSRPAAG